jgi:hypothetical protein
MTFKKIKKYQIIRLIIVLICIPILFLSLIEIRGDGLGFSALYGRYKTERFLTYIEKGDFSSAAGLTAFTGGIYQNLSNEDQAKKEWISGMKKLKDEGIEIISHSKNNIITDDRFTSGDVIVLIKYKDTVHDFRVFISTNSGKVEPGNLSSDIKFDYSEPTDAEKILVEKVSKVIITYNPG